MSYDEYLSDNILNKFVHCKRNIWIDTKCFTQRVFKYIGFQLPWRWENYYHITISIWLLSTTILIFITQILINPFAPNTPFLYPLKTSENLTVFWSFQGVEKECIGDTWAHSNYEFSHSHMLHRLMSTQWRI